MSLINLNLKNMYDSRVDNIYSDFFNKVLANSHKCQRLGGLFSSKNFAACAIGMQEFIQNDGTMELVLSPIFTPEDADAIYAGTTTQEDKISESWIKQFDEIKDKFEQDHTRALAWLLKNKHLTIKIAIFKDSTGRPIDDQQIYNVSLLKTKIGIYHGRNNEFVSFKGNIDFDDPILGEAYNFDVFRYWDKSERDRVEQHHQTFLQYWDGARHIDEDERTVTMIDLPIAVHKNLISKSFASKDQIQLTYLPAPRSYQRQAVDNWINNDGVGILEMATGTGKSITAINALTELHRRCPTMLVVAVSPFDTIAQQWHTYFTNAGFNHIITLNNPKWKQDLRDLITLLNLDAKKDINIVITSYNTYSSKNFIELIQTANVPLMLLADEVHHAGAPTRRRGLLPDYKYRLGLTATFERYYDDEGTKTLLNYFDSVVFIYDLKQAINDKILVEYYYYPHYVDLTEHEYDRYVNATNRIAMLWDTRDKPGVEDELELAIIQRSRIVRDAANKILKFYEIINNNPNLKHTLIYCSEKQIDDVQTFLLQTTPTILSRRITASEPKNREERTQIMQDLANEDYHAVVAIGVLDEGIDIPEAKHCILLSSSGNPKQFIQRRGRVLRRFSGRYKDNSSKDFAVIHDILVLTGLDFNPAISSQNIVRSILRSQIDRQSDMATLAINSDECLSLIESQRRKIGDANSQPPTDTKNEPNTKDPVI